MTASCWTSRDPGEQAVTGSTGGRRLRSELSSRSCDRSDSHWSRCRDLSGLEMALPWLVALLRAVHLSFGLTSPHLGLTKWIARDRRNLCASCRSLCASCHLPCRERHPAASPAGLSVPHSTCSSFSSSSLPACRHNAGTLTPLHACAFSSAEMAALVQQHQAGPGLRFASGYVSHSRRASGHTSLRRVAQLIPVLPAALSWRRHGRAGREPSRR